jgi:hypothetical protein
VSFVEDFLEHYGVKGMRWGVKKANNRVRFTGKSKTQTTYKKPAHKLTDRELQARVKRLETERKYNDLNREQLSAGRRLATEILTNSGRKAATTILSGVGILAAKNLLEGRLPGASQIKIPK